MRLKGLLVVATAGGLIVLAAAFAFSLHDFVTAASVSGPAQPATARDLDFSDLGGAVGADPTRTINDLNLQAAVATSSIYPTPLGSARCWVKQGRTQPGQSVAFHIQVRDSAGQSVVGAPVAFSIALETNVSGSGVSPSATSSGASGSASPTVTIGSLSPPAGFVSVQALAGGGSNTVSCQAVILVR